MISNRVYVQIDIMTLDYCNVHVLLSICIPIECHYSCNYCFDNTAETCISCSYEDHIRVLKGNICKCADGYYEESGIALCKSNN